MTNGHLDAGATLDRLKRALGMEEDKALAAALGMGPAALSQARRRNAAPLKQIIWLCAQHGIDLNAILLDKMSTVPVAKEPPAADYSAAALDEPLLRELYLWVEREAGRYSAELRWEILMYLYEGALEDAGKAPDERTRQRVLRLVSSR